MNLDLKVACVAVSISRDLEYKFPCWLVLYNNTKIAAKYSNDYKCNFELKATHCPFIELSRNDYLQI